MRPSSRADGAPPHHRRQRRLDARHVERAAARPRSLALQLRARAVAEEGASEHDAHDRRRPAARGPPRAPPASWTRYLAMLRRGSPSAAVSISVSVCNELGTARGQAHADEAAHRQPDEVTRRRAEPLDQRRRVVGEPLHVVRRRRGGAAPLPAMVVGDAAIPARRAPPPARRTCRRSTGGRAKRRSACRRAPRSS